MITVSIIVPCYNEEATIFLLLDAIHQQTYPREKMEVIIADGLSTDRTRLEINRFQEQHPQLHLKVVDNPKRIIPSALNRAIEAATGEYVIRLDAHCLPYPEYVERCIHDLESGYGEIVGGVWEIRPWASAGKPPTWIARGIAIATSHPLGVGDAYYRFTVHARVVDTVPFGAFRRTLVDQIGFYNETLLTNEDYEFYLRLRNAHGKVWLDPIIRSVYFPRSTFRELIRQYWRYGFWKGRMLLNQPASLRWRQALPPVFVASLLVLLVLAPFWKLAAWLLLFQVGLYLAALAAVGLQAGFRQKEPLLAFSTPLAIACMHLTWGSGVLYSLAKSAWMRLK